MLRKLFRKHRLKIDASKEKTGLIPLKQIRRMTVLMDVSIADFELCDKRIRSFCKAKGISLSILYIDFRKSGQDVAMKTAAEQTLTKRDVNWYGRPAVAKASLICAQPSDVFICLVADACLKSSNRMWCVEYISKTIRAKLKMGLAGCSFMHDDKFGSFDMLVSDPAASATQEGKDEDAMIPQSYGQIFNVMADFLEKTI